jgi:membrane fusion protein (multidrug efflux system)
VFLALTLASCLLVCACGKGDDDAKDDQPVAVATLVLQPRTVPLVSEFTGRTDSESTVELRARISGFLKKINFVEGSLVKKGICSSSSTRGAAEHPGPHQRRRGPDKAQLDYARKERARFEALVKQGAVSQQEYDAKVTNERQLPQRGRRRRHGSEARVNLGYTRVLAPQDGRIGKSNFKVGDLVNPGENSLLATISATDNFTVTFNITERDYLYVAKEYVEAKAKGAEYKPQPATVVLADGPVYPHQGFIDMADRAIDPSTGTLPVRAVFPNPDGIIKPGLFAKVRIEGGVAQNALLVPEQAISDVQGNKIVFVVDKDGKAQSRPVTFGRGWRPPSLRKRGWPPARPSSSTVGRRCAAALPWLPRPSRQPPPQGSLRRSRPRPRQVRAASPDRNECGEGAPSPDGTARFRFLHPIRRVRASTREPLDGQFLHSPPYFLGRHLHHHHHCRRPVHRRSARLPVSQPHRALHRAGGGQLQRRQRPGGGGDRGRAHRAAGERRGRNALHELRELQRRPHGAERLV